MINWSELPTRGFNTASKSATDALEFARKNPRTAGVAVVGAGGLIILAAPAIVVTLAIGILNLAGFGSGGIVAGKLLGYLKLVDTELICSNQAQLPPLPKP
jgi:hypothetical protein